MFRTALMTAATAACAAVVFLAGAGTALAPEPAQLVAPLVGYTGEGATAVYVNTGVTTAAVKWPASWTYNASLHAGQACSTTDLAANAIATQVIQANGSYRRCA